MAYAVTSSSSDIKSYEEIVKVTYDANFASRK